LSLSEIVRHGRTSTGLTQAQVAARASVSPHAVWELERGNGTVAMFGAVLDALDVRLAGLPRGRSIAERVRTARLRRGLSLESLAARAGVSKGALLRLENGNARLSTFEAVAAVLMPGLRARKPEFASWRGGARDCQFTPPEILAKVEAVLGGPIDLDPCAHPSSFVRARMTYDEADDGLSRPWPPGRIYANPPYSDSSAWLKKAAREADRHPMSPIMMLLPVRTHTAVFHELVAGRADVFLLRGRVAFIGIDGRQGSAPFGCMIVLFGGDDAMVARARALFDGVHVPRASLDSEGMGQAA